MKKLVVLGAGESGYGAAILGKKEGWDVMVSDSGVIAGKYKEKLIEAGIPFEEGGHQRETVESADLVVKSPGIPDNAEVVRGLCAHDVDVISEIEFAGRYTKARKICVTGSNGKTTTASLIYRILSAAGYDVALAGNIGDSFAYQVAMRDRDWFVLEISSFQLDGMSEFKADIAVLTNITPDHLDRYGNDVMRYAASKMRIIQNQSYDDYFIYCADDSYTMQKIADSELAMRPLPFSLRGEKEQRRPSGHDRSQWQGAYLDGENIVAEVGDRKFSLATDSLRIKGKHNILNAMAASLAGMAAGVEDEKIREAIGSFYGIEHRMEPAGVIDGVAYINDSKATNVDSVWYALECMDMPVVWIAGGTDKGNDYSKLEQVVRSKVKAIVLMGKDTAKLKAYFADIVDKVYDTDNLEDAMRLARASASAGDVVLLSPACASFDLFENYEDRGRRFKEWVAQQSQR